MLFKVDKELKEIESLRYSDIAQQLGKKEKHLEDFFKSVIGDEIFPQYCVFGNERSRQREADLFATDGEGNLVIFELKVGGKKDIEKIYQALRYAEIFSKWRYEDLDRHYRSCFKESADSGLLARFEEHFNASLDKSHFNRKQKVVVISNVSDLSVAQVTGYWRSRGIDIEEYFYRFYEIEGQLLLEISSDIHIPSIGGDCWINTNARYDAEAYLDMVANKKVSAYGSRHNIIGTGMNKRHVFLYQNGYGIIGVGRGTAKVNTITRKDGEVESFVRLQNFIHGVNLETSVIEKSIRPEEIKLLLEQDFWFASTIVPLSEEKAKILFQKCQEVFE